MKTTAKDGKLHNSRLQQTQDRGRGGTEASEHVKALTCEEHGKTRAGEAGKPRSIQQKSMHRKRDKQISQKDGPAHEALTGALGGRRALAEFNCMRGWPPRSSARERHM